MKGCHVFHQIILGLEVGITVVAFVVSIIRVNTHVVLELVLVAQDLVANLKEGKGVISETRHSSDL